MVKPLLSTMTLAPFGTGQRTTLMFTFRLWNWFSTSAHHCVTTWMNNYGFVTKISSGNQTYDFFLLEIEISSFAICTCVFESLLQTLWHQVFHSRPGQTCIFKTTKWAMYYIKIHYTLVKFICYKHYQIFLLLNLLNSSCDRSEFFLSQKPCTMHIT